MFVSTCTNRIIDDSFKRRLVRNTCSYLGLDGVGGQQDCGLRWTVDVHAEDGLLDLQEEQVLVDLLDQLLRDVLRVELGKEEERNGDLLGHILLQNLRTYKFFIILLPNILYL